MLNHVFSEIVIAGGYSMMRLPSASTWPVQTNPAGGNGPGISNRETAPSSGLGLRITRERLESLYGHDQSLEVLSLPEGGTTAQVCIPFLVRGRNNRQDTSTTFSRNDLPARSY
jgi:hypothetical protein